MKRSWQFVHLLFVLTVVIGILVGAAGSSIAGPGNGQGPPDDAGSGNGHGPPDDAGSGEDAGPPDDKGSGNGQGPPDDAGEGSDGDEGEGEGTESEGEESDSEGDGDEGGSDHRPGGADGDSTPASENRTLYNDSTGMTLYAGQDIPVGNVTVTPNGSDHLDITYRTTGGWQITETHLALSANDTSDIPQTGSGNPKIGRFHYNGTHDPAVSTVTYTIEVPEPNDGNITVAAHAVVEHPDEGEETAWADGDRFTERGSWATYFTYQLDERAVCPVSSDPGAGFVEILGVDSSNYPVINATVRVNTSEGKAGNLTEDHFVVCEDDRLQDESVTFVQSGTTGIDLVFVLDVSGSMGGEIATLQEQMRDYIQSFSANNTNARFALITYGGDEGGDGIVRQPLTDNVTAMQESINDTTASGGFENATDAYLAAQNLSTRSGATKVIVDITDEDDDGYYPNTNGTNETLNRFDTEGWLYVAISPELYDGDPADDQRTYAERLDGQWTDIQEIRDGNTTLDVVLKDLQAQLVTTYLVSYPTDLPATDGTNRTVLIYVDDPSGNAAETDSYVAPT